MKSAQRLCFSLLIFLNVKTFGEGLAFKSYARSKVQIQSVQTSFAAGQDLILLVDNECLSREISRKNNGSLIPGIRVQHKSSMGLKIQALHGVVGQEVSKVDLERMSQAQPCLIGVSENASVELAGFPGDPESVNQPSLLAIHQETGENYFFHPIFGIRQTVVAAVVDTGIELTHPDLISRIWHGPLGELGTDIFNGDSDPSDDFGHGTHVAGLLGAQRDNGKGIRGIMGDFVRLMPVKTQGSDGSGSVDNLVNGILWAADHGAEIINLSLTTGSNNSALLAALQYALGKNAVVVVASGNDGSEITLSNFLTPVGYAPDNPGLISVGAFDAASLLRPVYSNYSTHYVKLSAPGSANMEGLLSTYIGGTYAKLAGTSMASPQVAGAAAMAVSFLKTRGMTYSPASVEKLLEDSAVESVELNPYFANGRRLDMERLGRLIFNSSVIDATGGFDDP